MNIRLGTGLPFKPGHRRDIELFLGQGLLGQPLRWKRPRFIFVCSMTDLFGEFVTDEMIDAVFAVMAPAPWHRFLVLTKRHERMLAYLTGAAKGRIESGQGVRLHIPWPLPNVAMGVSVEDQRRAAERLSALRATPAALRFVSAEPLLGPVDFRGQLDGISMMISGGESGQKARTPHPAWFEDIDAVCREAGVAHHFKQWGEWAPFTGAEPPTPARRQIWVRHDGVTTHSANMAERWDREAIERDKPLPRLMLRLGKGRAGHLLNGEVRQDPWPWPAG